MEPNPVVKVLYKDEGDFGFITLVRKNDTPGELVPFDPKRNRPYGTLGTAKALAAEHGVPLEEV